MIFYFILFVIVGFILGKTDFEREKSFIILCIIAVIWGFIHNPFWGLVSFGELCLGYFIATIFNKKD